MSIAVTVLGSSAMFPTLERAASGYLVEVAGKNIWLDAGGGTWRNLLAYIDYRVLDAIVLSHRHPDHTTDAFQAFHARLYGDAEPLPPIPLWAPSETVDALTAFAPKFEKAYQLTPVAAGDSVEVGEAHMSFVRMAHPADTLGVRLESGGDVLAYSADTGADADFDRLAGGADLFVCEATFQDSDALWEGHLRASQAGEIAARAGVGRLLLTHLPPNRDLGLSIAEAQRTASGCDVQLAADGLRLEVG